jgi:hypothetical protein
MTAVANAAEALCLRDGKRVCDSQVIVVFC